MVRIGTRLKTVYLAGPDVFLPDAAAFGARKKDLCATYGLAGLFPLDNSIPAGTADVGGAIYRANIALIERADCGILNLTPFHGPSADVGTVFELGMLVALGKPVFAYTNEDDDLIGRLKIDPGLTYDARRGDWRDRFGMAAEDFGNADNLMIDASLATQGRTIHRRAVAPAGRFTDLDGFLACLAEAKTYFAERQA